MLNRRFLISTITHIQEFSECAKLINLKVRIKEKVSDSSRTIITKAPATSLRLPLQSYSGKFVVADIYSALASVLKASIYKVIVPVIWDRAPGNVKMFKPAQYKPTRAYLDVQDSFRNIIIGSNGTKKFGGITTGIAIANGLILNTHVPSMGISKKYVTTDNQIYLNIVKPDISSPVHGEIFVDSDLNPDILRSKKSEYISFTEQPYSRIKPVSADTEYVDLDYESSFVNALKPIARKWWAYQEGTVLRIRQVHEVVQEGSTLNIK